MKKNELINTKVDIKLVISGLWVSMMILYIYNDFFHLFKPDAIQEIIDGNMGPFAVTQTGLFFAAVLMAIPVIMGLLTLILNAKISRIANIVVASLYTVVNIANIPGEWAFYVFLGIIQIVFTLLIIWCAVKWPRQDHSEKL